MRDIIWTRPAEEDLRAIFDFLTDEIGLSEPHALSIIDRLFEKADSLSTGFPNSGQREPLLEEFPQTYRYLIEGNYNNSPIKNLRFLIVALGSCIQIGKLAEFGHDLYRT